MHKQAVVQLRSAAPPHTTWSQTFPASTDQAQHARRSLALLLDGFPAADDALLCLSELVTNAVLHSNSARPGGQFSIRATLADGRLRVEVTDQGGPWKQPGSRNPQGGRGFVIVNALAHAHGMSGDGITSRTVWFEITSQ
jgi:anti-sigma regulatory factor (Ser/Thr protein kinase)